MVYLCMSLVVFIHRSTPSSMLNSLYGLSVCLLCCWACARKAAGEDPKVWQKIDIDFHQLDQDGLSGPPDGKVAVHFEFCIPRDEKKWAAVQKIYPELQRQTGARGRIGCTADQWLVIGSTHQPRYKRGLYELASLPYVAKIATVYWE